jgi:TolB-like protein/DNA-binding SARP family transcriptional activator/tetratricopeptide (TPR) repeat protein
MPADPNQPSHVHLTALGGLRVERDEDAVAELPAQPVRCALLVYLAVERGASRDELTALLWPERSSGRARRLLSQTLYELRRQLGDDWVATRGERVEATDALTVDAIDFITAADSGQDEAALGSYGGAFLEGCHLGGTAAFEQWTDRRRGELARRFREVCRRLTSARIEAADTVGALEVARRWAEADPLEDEAHHHIIALLAETGRRTEALHHYGAYRDLIARELEVEPLEETQALVARIREGSAADGSPELAHSAPAPRDPAPVARRPESGPGLGQPVASYGQRRRHRRIGVMAAAVGTAVVLVWSGAKLVPGGGSAGGNGLLDPAGIAVLPFQNLSGDPEQEYFSDGITEDLLTSLARIDGLTVISRASVMGYKGTDRPVRQIGEELGVAHVLTGSVRRSGDRVRVAAQLIDARVDRQLWAESYDRELTDIFVIQSEISQRIAAALRTRLTPDQREQLEGRSATNLTAWDFYLQGRSYLHRMRREDHHRAIELFYRAIQTDSSFALAWAGLGEAYATGPGRYAEPRVWTDSGMVAARRAIALDPALAEGYLALGTAYLTRALYRRAEETLDRALALNPNLASAVGRSAVLRFASGQYDEATRLSRRSIALDPASRVSALAILAVTYGALGLFDRAYEANDALLALEPDNMEGFRNRVLLAIFAEDDPAAAVARAEDYVARHPDHPRAWMNAATAWLYYGDHDQARGYLERMYERSPTAWYLGRGVAVQLGYTLWKAGELERARRLFDGFERFALEEIAGGNEDPELRYSLAALHAIQGDREEAYRWLDEMIAAGWSHAPLLRWDPLLEALYGDIRFDRILASSDAELARQRARVEREGW